MMQSNSEEIADLTRSSRADGNAYKDKQRNRRGNLNNGYKNVSAGNRNYEYTTSMNHNIQNYSKKTVQGSTTNKFINNRNSNSNWRYNVVENSVNYEYSNGVNENESNYSQRYHDNKSMNYRNSNRNSNRNTRNNISNHNSSYEKRDIRLMNERSTVDITKFDQRELIKYELKQNKYECMICMNVVTKEAAIWSCIKCYHIFHLHCIKKWATQSTETNNNWRCPACQNVSYDQSQLSVYTCFCTKQKNPVFRPGTTPHSCGDVCSRANQSNERCPHLCAQQCHPGPCPPCESSLTRPCNCGRTTITARCTSDNEYSQWQCQSFCEQTLQCGLHKCEKQCHNGECGQCSIVIGQLCWCGKSSREVLCGSLASMSGPRYECGSVCDRLLTCGNHRCTLSCHSGDCESCQSMPETVTHCWCGQKTLTEMNKDVRTSCLDPVPSCGTGICGRILAGCGHSCETVCHGGPCPPCPHTRTTECRCRSTLQTVDCATAALASTTVVCKKVCDSKMSCGRHQCNQRCCDNDAHVCALSCNRLLTCKQHRCSLQCGHNGRCPPCDNVSFEELFCHCGEQCLLPPILCGTLPPQCSARCTRVHPDCVHPARHNCHSDDQCPPCTQLVTKPCPGGHTNYDNVPCFRPVTTCGQLCARPLAQCEHTCNKLCHTGPCLGGRQEEEAAVACTQPCVTPRHGCGHPCGAPCHDRDTVPCDQVMKPCQFTVSLTCPCGLRLSTVLCSQATSQISCDSSCIIAHTISSHHDKVYIASDNTSSSKVPIDTTAQCTQKCITTCHNAQSVLPASQKMCNSTSYQCVQRYYMAYYEEFARFNLKFVVSVEKVFGNFYQILLANEIDHCCEHKFLSITLEKAQFLRRFSSVYKLICLVSKNNDGTANVIVKADRGHYCNPRVLLSKKVEEKYFKM